MKDQDYIRKGVELADGFVNRSGHYEIGHAAVAHFVEPQWFIDALAAQLVRQVDVNKDNGLFILPDAAELMEGHDSVAFIEGPDRTMNTIKAIVDSEVLK